MYNILFVCYGNICRSPMAEMIFKDIVLKNNKKFLFYCDSKGTSMEEFGNDIYPKAKKVLEEHHVMIEKHKATMVKKEDYPKYHYIICMDRNNYDTLVSLFDNDPENKVRLLLPNEEIEDPWYTDRFEKVYEQINEGCNLLFQQLVEEYQNEANQ